MRHELVFESDTWNDWVAVKELKLSYHIRVYIVNNRVSPI